MSLEQLMLLASHLAQAPRPPQREESGRQRRVAPLRASSQLSSEEFEALSQIWSTPLRSQMAQPSSPVHH